MVDASGINLVMTCGACPEQYDAYLGDKVVGYLRYRWGHFSVRVPDPSGDVVYSKDIGGQYDGCGLTDIELHKAKVAIAEYLNEIQMTW